MIWLLYQLIPAPISPVCYPGNGSTERQNRSGSGDWSFGQKPVYAGFVGAMFAPDREGGEGHHQQQRSTKQVVLGIWGEFAGRCGIEPIDSIGQSGPCKGAWPEGDKGDRPVGRTGRAWPSESSFGTYVSIPVGEQLCSDRSAMPSGWQDAGSLAYLSHGWDISAEEPGPMPDQPEGWTCRRLLVFTRWVLCLSWHRSSTEGHRTCFCHAWVPVMGPMRLQAADFFGCRYANIPECTKGSKCGERDQDTCWESWTLVP